MNSSLLLLQIAVILGLSHLMARAFRRIHQPLVIGEMTAGILLGPTVFGAIAPGVWSSLFPPASLTPLSALSQVGLVLFVFLVGVRVEMTELRDQSRTALVVGTLGVVIPFIAALPLAHRLYPAYGHGSELVFSLFLATAMSITAFPVLARILIERNLLNTPVGSVAIASAALGDFAAWVLLAIVVALSKHGPGSGLGWIIAWPLLAYFVAAAGVALALRHFSKKGKMVRPGPGGITLFVAFALLSASAAEWAGIHALVGAFIAGLVIPHTYRAPLIEKLEAAIIVLLIPIFFTLTGLRTNLEGSVGRSGILDLALILTVAIASKWGGTFLGGRLSGMSSMNATKLGLLMNTRGLVELVILSVGLESGILSPALFSMMVLMALVTTFMAGPLLNLADRRAPKAAAVGAD